MELNNKYGVTNYTLEIPRQDMASNLDQTSYEKFPYPSIENSDVDYHVVNIQGQLILQTKVYNEIESLPKGIYIIKTIKSNGQTESSKIFIK